MGDYATTTAISELLPQFLSGNSTSSDTAGMNLFSRHIDRAESVVKAFASSRYDVAGFRIATTTTNVPPILRNLSEDIASWNSMRSSYAQDGNLKQVYLDAFERALDILKDIRDGKTKLSFTDGSEVPTRTTRFLTSTDYSHIFNLDDPNSWIVDVDQVNDIADTRA